MENNKCTSDTTTKYVQDEILKIFQNIQPQPKNQTFLLWACHAIILRMRKTYELRIKFINKFSYVQSALENTELCVYLPF